MTTNDDMTPRQPDEDELLGDAPDFVDETVARITDADVSEHLRRVLNQSGYTGQMPGQWPPQHRIDLDCPLNAVIASEYQEMANLAATVQANARLSRESLRQAKKMVDAARQEAEQIVSAAHDEADEALKQAAQMVRDAREQAAQIISAARREAEQIVTDARSLHASLMPPFQFPVSESGNTGSEIGLITAPREAVSKAPVYLSFSALTRHLDLAGQSAADGSSGIGSNSLAELPEYLPDRLDGIETSFEGRLLVWQPKLFVGLGGTGAAVPAPLLPADPARAAGNGFLIGSIGEDATSAGILTAHHVAEAALGLNPGIPPLPGPAEVRPVSPVDGQIRAMLVFDIAGFTEPERDDDIHRYLHKGFYELLKKAFDGSGIPWNECLREDRGDGALIVVPPCIACEGISEDGRYFSLASPDVFQSVRFQVKQVRNRARTYLPGPRATQVDPAAVVEELVSSSRRHRLRAWVTERRDRCQDDDNPNERRADLGRIKTLHPRTYSDARTIGEHFRAGTPVIMNLTGMTNSDAKRLVDFSAGLTFALRGSIERVTDKVFLVSPASVEVTAEDKARLTEYGTVEAGRFGAGPDAQAAIDDVDAIQVDCSALGNRDPDKANLCR